MEAARRLQRTRYRRGEVIVAEGEPANRFYVITSGEAEVIQWSADRDVYIRTLQPGQFFGELGLLTSGRRSATVRAVGNVKALTLDEGAFNQLVRRSESTAAGLAQLLQVRSVRVTPRGDAIPLPAWTRLMQRVFKHPRLRHYNRLIALVMAVNVAVLWYGLARGAWWSGKSPHLTSIALVAVTNFGLAIILRQQYVINFLCWLGTLPPTSWPLRLRWMFGKYYHFGGLHVGAAIAGTLWYAAFVGSLTYDLARGVDHVSVVNVAMSYAVVALFIIIIMALPHRRGAAHDKFEVTHRLCGWAALLLVCVDTVLFVAGQRDHSSLSSALLTVDAATQGSNRRRTTVRARRCDQLGPGRETRGRDHPTDQPQAVRGMASIRQRSAARRVVRLSHGHLSGRRLDRCVHRRSTGKCVGAGNTDAQRGQRGGPVHEDGLRHHR